MRRTIGSLIPALFLAACSTVNTPTDPTTPPSSTPTPANTYSYTAVGASDAICYGSSNVCFPFDQCPDGKGYVQLIRNRLKDSGKTVSFLNPSVPGGVLSPEIQGIGNALGRGIPNNFIDNEGPFVAKDSNLVTVFAGGNDVNTIGAAIDAGYGGSNVDSYIQTRVQGFGRDMKALIGIIKGRAPQARIVVLNLPNLAAMPYASGYTLLQKRTLQTIAVGFSAQINALTADGALVVDLMCDPTFYQSNIYSSDGFHPNDTGYSRMADVVYAPASTGVASPPKSSCSQMTLY